MAKNGKNLQVEAIQNGTVIDHIPAGQGVKILKHLHLLESQVRVTVGFNLPSKAMGFKDIIKIESRLFSKEEANELAIFSPHATINIIKDYQVEKKEEMALPSSIKGLFVCPNSNCITHDEPVLSLFFLSERQETTVLKCKYCEKSFTREILAEL